MIITMVENNWLSIVITIIIAVLGISAGIYSFVILTDLFQLDTLILAVSHSYPWLEGLIMTLLILTGILCVLFNGPLIGVVKTVALSLAIGIIIWIATIVIGLVMIFIEEPNAIRPLALIIGMMIPSTITIWIS